MGLISQVLLLPVAPLRFTVWVAEQIDDEVQHSTGSAAAVTQQLDALEEARETGELDAEEAERRQGEVIEQIAKPAALEEGERGG